MGAGIIFGQQDDRIYIATANHVVRKGGEAAQIIGKQITFQSAFISTGHSGGGLLNEQAELLGMIRADQPPFGVAIRIESILQRLRQWELPVQLRTATVNVDANFQSAIKARDIKRLERLLIECDHVGTRDTTGWTPLHEAASQGWAAAVKPLLAAGLDVNAKLVIHPDKPPGLTPLHVAAALGNSEVAAVLAAGGADVNARIVHQQDRDWGPAPLHLAAESGATEAAGVLLKNGARVNAKSNFGTPLMIAAKSQLTGADMAKLLIENGADPDAKGWQTSPLHYASRRNAAGIIEILLANGADINKQGPMKYTALHYAAQRGSTEAVRLLLEGGADVETNEYIKGRIFRIAAERGPGFAEFLIKVDFDIFGHTGNGSTLLHLSVENGQVELTKFLIRSGADVNAKGGSWDRSPLHLAALHGQTEILKLLIKAGADVLGRNGTGKTPLHDAVEYPEIVTLLLEAGADVNAFDHGGNTPLHLAAEKQIMSSAKLLIAAGADKTARDKSSLTPKYRARSDDMIALFQTGWLGVQIQDVTQELADYLGLERPSGTLIESVVSGGPADKANLMPKDIILQYSGHPLESSKELPPLVHRTPVGKNVVLKVLRQSVIITVEVRIGKKTE